MLSAQNAYKTLMDIGGLETEEEYGYDGEDEACKFNRSKVAVRVSGGVEISQDEEEMAKWLLKNGPISIALNAFAMQFYMGGVCFTMYSFYHFHPCHHHLPTQISHMTLSSLLGEPS